MINSRSLHPIVSSVATLLRNAFIAVAAAGLGLGLGMLLTTRNATWPITLIGLSFYALVILAQPLAGLLLWVVTAPFSRFAYLDIVLGRGIPDLTLTRICAGLLLAIVLAQLSIGKLRLPRFTRLDAAIVAMLIGIGLSLPASLDGLKYAVTSFSDTYLVPAVIYLLARILVRQRRQAEAVCSSMIVLGVILTTVAVQEQVTGQVTFAYSVRSWVYTKELHKLAGLLGSPAFFAALIAMTTGCATYRFAHAAGWRRLAYGGLLPYLALGVYYTYNRAGYISLALSLLLAALAWPQVRRAFAVAALAGAVALILSWSTVQQSAVVTERLGARGPVDYRLEIWGRAAQILSHEPLLGLGYSNFGRVYLRYNPSWADATVLPAPHNSVLEVAFNSGVAGVVPYVATGLVILTGVIGQRRRTRGNPDDRALVTAFAIVLVPYLVEAMVIDMVSAYYVNMVMMLAVGALFGWQTEESDAGRHSRPVPDGHLAPGGR